jgi:hypothetical protein
MISAFAFLSVRGKNKPGLIVPEAAPSFSNDGSA